MPLEHGASNRVRQRNIEEMIASGHDPRQSVAAAYREQREARAKGRRKMGEGPSHAPGHEISGESGAVRQRNRMGQGGGAMHGESFGVEPFHRGNMAGGHMHGDHVEHDGMMLHDHHRAGPPAIHQGDGQMSATAHSHHGPHGHHEHGHVPKGTRHHHVGGHHVHGKHHRGG